MFSSNVHLLPSLYTYEDVKKYYEDTPPHRRKKWEHNQRGLDGQNKWHYRIEKHSDDEYWVCLYETPIVKWFGPERVIVDISYNTTLTFQFAHRYTQALGSVYNHESKAVFEVDGIKWHAKTPFEFALLDTPPGAPKHLRKYKLISTHEKIKRKVLDPDKAWEYR